MDTFAEEKGVVASLARLRTNALLALATGGERIVSRGDIKRLDEIAANVCGTPLDQIDFAPFGTGPKPDGPIFKALREKLPEEAAS
jgi:hypothetical protein